MSVCSSKQSFGKELSLYFHYQKICSLFALVVALEAASMLCAAGEQPHVKIKPLAVD